MLRDKLLASLPVYLVMSLAPCGERTALETAREALAGGVTMLQLREKNASIREVLAQGQQLRTLCSEFGAAFIVNDRVDVALLLEADGVHVGQDDLPGAEARRLMGDDKIIGISAGTMVEAEWAMANGADYLGVGPVYSTSTKQDAGEAIGTGLIRDITRRWNVPLVGIGGIHHGNASAVIEAGAGGVAVVSAITKQPDPHTAARELVQAVNRILS